MKTNHTTRRVRAGIVLLLTASTMLAVVDKSSPASAIGGQPIAFGAFPQPQGGQTPQQAVTQLESQLGRQLEVVRVFELWNDAFPDSYHNFLKSGDRSVILSVKPTRNGTRIPWASLANAAPGTQLDNEMRSWARRIRDFQAPIYVTLHHEPESSTGAGTAAEYIAAWRHWVEVFRQEGASNAQFMWIMTDYSFHVPQSDQRHAPKWYPGDQWTDAMGVDAYNWHECRPNQDNVWKSLGTILEPYRAFGAAHPSVDLWVTEWASWEDPDVPGRKAAWIDEARALFKTPAYSQFAGVLYFHSRAINQNFTDCIWLANSTSSSMARFTAMANDPFYMGDAFGQPPPDPIPPTADFTFGCYGLACDFTSSSTDPDGTITQYAWDFDDGSSASTGAALHTFPASGTYSVELTVTDDDLESGSVTHDVVVAVAPPVASPAFRASSQATGLGTGAAITVPAAVVAGDRLVLIITANNATTATTPTGWTLLATQSDGSPDMRSWVFTRTAVGGTAGSTVTSTLGTSSRSSRILLAYANAGSPTLASAATGATATNAHATPGTTAAAGSRVVSYWSDETDTNTGWALPATVQLRQSSVGTSTGRITAAAGDSNSTGGAQPVRTAMSTASSAKAIMWSIALPAAGPPPPNQPPVAAFTSACNGLACTFSAVSSTDSDGTVVNATWDFGDTDVGAGLETPHTFDVAGAYTVTVTVFDDDGAPSAAVSRLIDVAPVAASPISFVGTATSNLNATNHQVTVPAGVQTGDALVLVFTANNNATVTGPSGIAGWQLLGVESNGSMSTRVWTRVATSGNAGATVGVTTSTYSKGNLVLSAYRGTSTVAPVAGWDSTLENVSRATHTTPAVPVVNDASWVVWYWVHKDSTTVQLVPPAGVTVRSNANQGGGSGKVTGLLADSNGPVGTGAATNLTATASSANSSATMWTIVLAPG